MCEAVIMLMLPVTEANVEKNSDLCCVPYPVLTIWEDSGPYPGASVFILICSKHIFIGISAVWMKAVSVQGSGLSFGQVVSHM